MYKLLLLLSLILGWITPTLNGEQYKDYYEFYKAWEANPDNWEQMFKENKDFGFRVLVEEPLKLSYTYYTKPKAFCEIVAFNPYLIAIWRSKDPEAFKEWLKSKNGKECLAAHAKIISQVDYVFTTAVLENFPDLFVPFAKEAAVPAYVLGWANYQPDAFNKVYQSDAAAKAYIDNDPQLKTLVKQKPL